MKKKDQAWLEEAKWDIENARILFNNQRYSTAVFHSQQAAEKAIKALLYSCNLNGWGHSIKTLLDKYNKEVNRPIDIIEKEARNLDREYITTRYPDALPEIAPHEAYDKDNAEFAIAQAEKVLNFVENELTYFEQLKEEDNNSE